MRFICTVSVLLGALLLSFAAGYVAGSHDGREYGEWRNNGNAPAYWLPSYLSEPQ